MELVGLIDSARDGHVTVRAEHRDSRMELATASPTANYSASYGFAAHAAAVFVDRDTGAVEVLDYVAAHDVGRALNPTMAEGQITGAVVQGLGAALREELIVVDGRVANGAFVNYPLPRFGDAPRVRPVLVEGPEPAGPYDAKGLGEIPILPVAPALANAVHDAIGVRLHDLPMTPDKVLSSLRHLERWRTRRYHLWRRPDRWQIAAFRRAYPLGVKRLLEWGTRFARSAPRRDITDVERPKDLAAALIAVRASGAMPVGGATDVVAQRAQGLAAPVTLVSTSRLQELREFHVDADGSAVIGGAVTLAALEAHELLPPVLRDAVATIASPQIRATATVAGNLLQANRCPYFRNGFPCYKRGGWTCPCYAVTGDHRFYHAAIGGHRCQAVTPSDLATVLIALDADVVLASSTHRRRVPVSQLYRGPGEAVLRGGELLIDVRLPSGSGTHVGSFQKLGLWHGDFALVSLALTAALDTSGRISRPRAVFGALAPTPWRSRALESMLAGAAVSTIHIAAAAEALDRELDRVAHPLQANEWKLDAAVGLVRKALRAITAPGLAGRATGTL